MGLRGEAMLLKIFIGEADRVNGHPLYEEIVFEARNQGLAGASVHRGIMSYGASHSIHTLKIFELSSDLPIVIEIVDSEEKIKDFITIADKLLEKSEKGGLIITQPVEVFRYLPGRKYRKPISG
ncbi:MAG: DUF190 domain-containing protein [Bacteroidota bacterium]|nr:DUF190 domain-containing protein [Bacteroidota bacterium]MDP4205713.1 DUF190 domain-containing protein [Bacteroidota bacterium]